MPKEFSRVKRVESLIQRELSLLIQQEIQDPEIGMVTVTEVRLSRDLEHATIFITGLNDTLSHDSMIDKLTQASRFLRSHLGKRCSLRLVPTLKFKYDKTLESAARIDRLIESGLPH